MPFIFSLATRQSLFELTAYGVSETVFRLQSRLLHDKVERQKQHMASGELQEAMDLADEIEELSIGKRKSDVARAAVPLADGSGIRTLSISNPNPRHELLQP